VSRADVALVTCCELPDLDPDDRPLAAALRARGLRADIVAWDDRRYDWSQVRLALLRNPWDYYRRVDEFLAWAAATSALTRLENPIELLRWNLHKGYLVELAKRGAPVVPTWLVRRGERIDLAALATAGEWERIVVKPAVSADSWETHVVGVDQLAVAQSHAGRLAAERDVLVQPFLDSVERHGERCLVFVDGTWSHAVRKNALTQGGRWAGLPEGTPVEPSAAELAAAGRVLDALPFARPLYARVDLVHDRDGAPRLLELELAEPTLFLADSPAGLERFVAAIERRLVTSPSRP